MKSNVENMKIVHSSPKCEEKMKDFERKKRRVGVYKSWRVRGELYSDDSMGRPVAPKRNGKW